MLFLSKLLPLFVYPLGLACLLLIVALVCFWRRPRVSVTAIFLALLVLVLGGNQGVAIGLIRSLESQNIPTTELPSAAAIVVLGGGTKPALPPRPWVDLGEEGDRTLYGALLYRRQKAPWLILSGGRIIWGQSDQNIPPESVDMAAIAQAMGVPDQAILQDSRSANTYENAVNVSKILAERGIQRRVLLVTSALHMPRSRLIFQRQGIEVISAPTDFLVTEADLEQNSLQASLLNLIPDAEKLLHSSRALKEYIGLLVYRLRGWL